jgi:hypothetical protein
MPKPPTRDQIRHPFAQTIQALRLKAGISQEALNLGIDRGHTPSLYTVLRLLADLHVTFVEFARQFEPIQRAQVGAGGRTTVPKRKGTRHNVR